MGVLAEEGLYKTVTAMGLRAVRVPEQEPLFASVDCMVIEDGQGRREVAARVRRERIGVVMIAHDVDAHRALALEHLSLLLAEPASQRADALQRAIFAAAQSTWILREAAPATDDDDTVRRAVPPELMIQSLSLPGTGDLEGPPRSAMRATVRAPLDDLEARLVTVPDLPERAFDSEGSTEPDRPVRSDRPIGPDRRIGPDHQPDPRQGRPVRATVRATVRTTVRATVHTPAPAAFMAYPAPGERSQRSRPVGSGWLWLALASLALVALGYMLSPALS